MIGAVAGLPFPTFEVTTLVVLVAVPAVAPVTVTLNVQVPLGAIVAPLSVMVVDVADSRPPHIAIGGVMGVTVTTVGTVSVKPTPVRVVVVFVLLMVKVSVEVAPTAIEDGEKIFVIAGPFTVVTVIGALAVFPLP